MPWTKTSAADVAHYGRSSARRAGINGGRPSRSGYETANPIASRTPCARAALRSMVVARL